MLFVIKILVICAAVYGAALAYLYVFQDRILFRSGGGNPFEQEHQPFMPFVYQTPVGMNLRGLWYPPQEGKKLIVYFHGSRGHLGQRLYKARAFIAEGYGFALVGYRGYDGNPGFPNEKNLTDDAASAIQALVAKGFPVNRMVFYGESLGTGVAVPMAVRFPQAAALVLEAPYTSVIDVAANRFPIFPVRHLLRHHFNNEQYAASLFLPVLVLHGNKDKTVPLWMGQRLFEQMTGSPKKEMTVFKNAAHVNIYDYGAKDMIHAFLQQIP